MKTFDYVEEYILAIAGVEDPVTFQLGSNNALYYSMFMTPLINLARYDKNPIDNFTKQICANTGFTKKQADLALKIVIKYRRQLAKHDIDTSPMETLSNVKFKIPMRELDYTRSITYDADANMVDVRFPYAEELIKEFRTWAREGTGRVEWNKGTRVWNVAPTSGNLYWLSKHAAKHNFEVDVATQTAFDVCNAAEPQTPTLRLNNGELEFENFAPSLTKFITERANNNILRAADYAPVCLFDLGLDVHDHIPYDYMDLITSRIVQYPDISEAHSSTVETLCNYIKETDRFPVVVYDAQGHAEHSLAWHIKSHFASDDIHDISGKEGIDASKKIIIVNAMHKELEKLGTIKMFISSNNLTINAGRKSIITNAAEKFAFFCHSHKTGAVL